MIESSCEAALVALALDRHAKKVRGSLQKCQIMLDKISFRAAVDLQNSEWPQGAGGFPAF